MPMPSPGPQPNTAAWNPATGGANFAGWNPQTGFLGSTPANPNPGTPGYAGSTVAGVAAPGSGVLGASPTEPPAASTANLGGLTSWLNGQTNSGINSGLNFASGYFGNNNPQIAQIESAEQQQMKGFSQAQINAMRDQGTSQINAQVGTGIHALAGMNSANHIAGGAAAAGALPLLSNANTQEAQLANNINVASIAQQNQGLSNFQNTVTNERAGGLNTAFGVAGLGTANDNAAMQYGLGGDYLNWANQNLGANPGPGGGGGGGGTKAPLGSTFANWGKDSNNWSNGNPAGRFFNTVGLGGPGAIGTGLQGGNGFANTAFDGSTYNSQNLNPSGLAGNNMINPFAASNDPSSWSW